jgi:hypothetical protein
MVDRNHWTIDCQHFGRDLLKDVGVNAKVIASIDVAKAPSTSTTDYSACVR